MHSGLLTIALVLQSFAKWHAQSALGIYLVLARYQSTYIRKHEVSQHMKSTPSGFVREPSDPLVKGLVSYGLVLFLPYRMP